ncbi:MAG: hypothetical protein IJD30_03880 [Clostridia bacterium]|nr:hypothetical protein [Clostridia bacterium]
MLINAIIVVLAAICIIRTVSYGIWTIRSKNISGGIAVLVLALLAAVSVIFVI